MQAIMRLRKSNLITEQQFLTAARFKRDPNSFKMSPTFFRFLREVILEDRPLEEIERQRGWAARSAKVVLSMILYSLEEIGGDVVQPEKVSELREQIAFLTVNNDVDVYDMMKAYGLTKMEARLLIILQRANGATVTKEQIMHRLYAHDNDNSPTDKIADVYVCKLRKKLKNRDIRIETIWGVGYRIAA